MMLPPETFVAKAGTTYSLRVTNEGEFALTPFLFGLYGLLQVSVEKVLDDGTVVERALTYLERAPRVPGRGWEWAEEAWRRQRSHPVLAMPEHEAAALVERLCARERNLAELERADEERHCELSEIGFSQTPAAAEQRRKIWERYRARREEVFARDPELKR